MAGRGPAPKPSDQRARGKRSEPNGLRVIVADPTPQPELPVLMVKDHGDLITIDWPDITREWWAMWAGSPLSSEFTATDWSELRDTARLHAMYWLGNADVASELRLRVAKFGATPEDRARLRIVFAQADDAEQGKPKPSGRPRRPSAYKGLRVVGDDGALAGA